MNKKEIKEAVCRAVDEMPQGKAIKRVCLFGSYLHGDAKAKSDVDLLIDFDESAEISLFDMVDIQDAFSETLGKTADLGTPEGISKYIKEKVLAEAEVLYER